MVKYLYDKYNAIGTIGNYTEQSTNIGIKDFNYNTWLMQVQDAYEVPRTKVSYGGRTLNEQNGLYTGYSVIYSENNIDVQTMHMQGKTAFYFIVGSNAYFFSLVPIGGNQYRVQGTKYSSVPGATTYSRGSLIQSNVIAEDGTYPTNGRHTDGFWYVRGALANAAPTITLATTDNRTLYENDTFKIDGSAVDSDVGNIVNVYYRINGGLSRAIATGISTGASIPFNEQLTFKAGKLHKDEAAITDALAEGPAHRLEVWSEDNQGGKSPIAERTFYVVPNRAPALTVDAFTDQSELINNDTIKLSGTSSDPDGNNVTVKYRVNEQAAVQIHTGAAGPWSFDISLKSLKDGENIIVVEVTDTYNFKSSRTIKLNKTENLTPLEHSVQRYKIVPPSGSAQGVLLWIQRDADQEVMAEISMTIGTEQEQFVPLTLDSTAPMGEDVEDYFKHRAETPAEHIALKLSWTGDKPITFISGALLQ